MKRSLLLLCGVVLCWNASAAEVEGVRLPEALRVGERVLVLNGAGVRSMFFFDMYVAALYLSEKKGSGDAILSSDSARRMEMHLLREISSETLSKSFDKSIRLNLAPAELAALDAQLKQMSALFAMMNEAKAGDVITMDYQPGNGTEISFNNVTIGRIEGAAFNVALLKVWLGNKPVQERLKKKLLGGR